MRYAKFLLVFLITVSSAQAEKPDIDQNSLDKSVVLIRSVRQDFDYLSPWKQSPMRQGIGTGFIIDGKRILTNAHNISNNKYLEVKKEKEAKRYPAKVAFVGHDCDLAVLTVEDDTFFDGTIPLKLAGIPKVNTTVSTYGFPMGGIHISVTEGIVSRIQMDIYAHSAADSHLVIQTDAAINPGNSGGPVMQNGKVVGVAFQGMLKAENIGYLIPTTVIKHFLEDIEDGKYDGFGSLGVTLYDGLHSVSYKDYLNIPPNEDGIVVTDTMMHSSIESILKTNDVITKIDDYNIDNDGMIEIYGLTLSLGQVIETKQIGETVQVTFYRDGKLAKETATVSLNRPIFEYAKQYDYPPRYVSFAGLTFVPATRNLLETWGAEWVMDMPHYLRYLFLHSSQLNKVRKRKEYVVLAGIMPDEINAYCDDFISQVVERINEIEIRSLDDVYEAFEQDANDFYLINFMGSTRRLPLDAKKARDRQPEILKKYNIDAEARLEVQK